MLCISAYSIFFTLLLDAHVHVVTCESEGAFDQRKFSSSADQTGKLKDRSSDTANPLPWKSLEVLSCLHSVDYRDMLQQQINRHVLA